MPVLHFADPEPWHPPEGLQRERCETCGGPALADAGYAGVVRCSACWSRLHGTTEVGALWPRHLRRFPGGSLPAPASRVDSDAPSGRPGRQPGHEAGSASPYRVLVAARPATAGQIPPGAVAVRDTARSADLEALCTYALAEELASGRMVHSCAVRVAGRGFGVWRDGSFDCAMWAGAARVHGQGHLLALAGGTPWVPPAPRTPPPVGPCPRCAAPVRWRSDKAGLPITWKHNRALSGEGERAMKVPCEI